MLWFDYLMFLVPGMALTIWAQARIVRARAAGSRILSGTGLAGAEVAGLVMRAGGASGVAVERAVGELSDYYDASGKVLRLSPGVYAGRSAAAVGVAAHEAGHAIQDAAGYRGRVVRDAVAPIAGLGSQVFWMLIAAGMLLGMFRLIVAAIALFSAVVLLQVLSLPVEFDAGRRGREALRAAGLVGPEEEGAVGRVLNAAAWAHVAAVLTGVLALISIGGRGSPAPPGPDRT